MYWINVLRDVVLIYILAVAGMLALQSMAGSEGLSSQTTAVSLLVLVSAGFAVSGALSPQARWSHLAGVLVVAWLAGLVGLALGMSFGEWLAGLPFLALCMALGGGFSYLLPRSRTSSRSNEYLD
jgi:hypothetical protein